MNRHGFLLGFVATAGQVLLLRELVTAFGGAELFIATALFGWLLWVALGAWIGGRSRREWSIAGLLSTGVLALLASLILARLSPLTVSGVVGEMIPLSSAVPISIILMAPVGFTVGLAFPVIARGRVDAAMSVAIVYLFEGLGAFAAGLALLVLHNLTDSNLAAGTWIGFVASGALALTSPRGRWLAAGLSVLLLAVSLFNLGDRVGLACDRLKYGGYVIEDSFDTHYGHQVILSRDSGLMLMTDNATEGSYPDPETAENLFLPAWLYNPDATELLLIGRPELGPAQLVTQVPGVRLTAIDPRRRLTERLGAVMNLPQGVVRYESDPSAALFGDLAARQFDLVALNAGRLDSYRNSRYMTEDFLRLLQKRLAPGGVLAIVTPYDTDRYVTEETRRLLSVMTATLGRVFDSVSTWPGTRTLLLATTDATLELPYDTLLERLGQLPYRGVYISDAYLSDRLSAFKAERLQAVIPGDGRANSVTKPILTPLQGWMRSKASQTDRWLMDTVLFSPWVVAFVPLLILALFGWSLRPKGGSSRFGLFVCFTAGTVSLSLELISFYVYQSSAGSLYSELAILIGTFMLGLSLGTYLASGVTKPGLTRLSLLTLLIATLLFGVTWSSVDYELALVYHALFLMVVALATGSLFVAAIRRYYDVNPARNRGAGYAWELVGSALGALVATSLLLPMIGLSWLLVSVGGLVVLTLVGNAGLGSK
jgi:spermidine synthase